MFSITQLAPACMSPSPLPGRRLALAFTWHPVVAEVGRLILIFQMAPVARRARVPAAASSSAAASSASCSSSSFLKKTNKKVVVKAKDQAPQHFSLDKLMIDIKKTHKREPIPPVKKEVVRTDGSDYKVDNGHMRYFLKYPTYLADPLGLGTPIPDEVWNYLLRK